MLSNVEAVIFDLDGTLIDSMWLWKAIDIEYLARYDLELPDNLQSEIEGMSFTETAEYFKKRFNLDDEIEDIKKVWNEMAGEYYLNKVTLKDRVKDFLKFLKENQVKIGIATSNSKELVNIIIERFELADYFHSIRTSCEVESGKPSPDIYLKVAQDLKVTPETCLVFEDVPNGILAGKAAGMKVCAVYDDFSKNVITEIKEISDYFIESFEEVISMIEDDNSERKNERWCRWHELFS